jgi:hypothetical protein
MAEGAAQRRLEIGGWTTAATCASGRKHPGLAGTGAERGGDAGSSGPTRTGAATARAAASAARSRAVGEQHEEPVPGELAQPRRPDPPCRNGDSPSRE